MEYLKKSLIALIFLAVCVSTAQENIFLERDFWKQQPNLNTVQEKAKEGNDPTQLNSNAFDAVVYALLENSREEVIDYLLSLEGNDIEKKTHDGRTYIFWAAYANDVKTMEKLLVKGAKLDVKDTHGYTPVTFAASTGQTNPKIYDLFQKHGAVISEEKNESGANLLLLVAPYSKDVSELDYFVSKGLNLHSEDHSGNGIFNYAAKNGNIELLQQLIDKGVEYKGLNAEGGNAFMFASQGSRGHSNSIEVYEFLKTKGLDPAVVTNTGISPLHSVAYSADPEVIEFFLVNGANANQENMEGDTPFLNAASRNSLEAVKLLTNHVEEIDHSNNSGQTALMMAVKNNKPNVVEFLLEQSADAQVEDKSGNNLAFYLFTSGKVTDGFQEKMELLKNHKVDFTAGQEKGNNLYHIAVNANDLELLEQLSPFNVDINSRNDEGLTPLHLAALKAENGEILKYLIAEGANVSVRTNFDESVHDLASENEKLRKNKVELNFLQ